LRMKQVPIDVWSTREKLALASSVARSGDQNWYSVSRPLKAFGEPNRPADWFSQKNCALQYSDMLEKVEQPKRKRGERGEDTAEESIVRKLTAERMEELKALIAVEREKAKQLKEEIDLIKSGKADDAFLADIFNRMKEAEKQKKIEEEKHKQWLKEREEKIAAIKASRINLIANVPKPKSVSSTITTETQSKVEQPVEIKTESQSIDSTISEPLSVEVEEASNPAIVIDSAKETTKEDKIAPNVNVCPSTSPLLTSLLQSPSHSSTVSSNFFSPVPHSKESMSPTKQVASSQSINSSNFLNTSSSSGSIVKQSTPPSTDKSVPSMTITTIEDISSIHKSPNRDDNSTMASTLSKLLESPSNTSSKYQTAFIEQNREESVPKKEEIEKQAPEITIIPIVIDTSQNEKEKQQELDNEVEKETTQTSEVVTVQMKTEAPSPPPSPTKQISENNYIIKNIKQEVPEPKEVADDNVFEEVTVKQEVEEIEEQSTASSELKTPGITPLSSRAKRRKPPPVTSTPTATRRSGRVRANREIKTSTEDESENISHPETGAKKFLTTDETTDASMSEESMDAGMKMNASKAPSVTESTPNSPASSIVHSEDAENLREYKLWKKSIMLLWRQAATHKYASLFLHPVTDDEAKGYSTVVYRPQDLTTIRKRIENGSIRTTVEFQRDIMQMFQNAIMYNSADHEVHQMAVEMQKEILEGIEDFIETQQQGSQSVELSKSRGRRSGVATPVSEVHEQDSSIAFRRKSRTSTDTDPGANTSTKAKTKKRPN
ncbi:bromodomain-containing protein 8-like isoform X2, partial [Dinothrombium tinctorium]